MYGMYAELKGLNVNGNDGRFNEEQQVNSPNLKTGMTAITYGENGEIKEVENLDDKWYSYTEEEKQWANAVTKDSGGNVTGYWVWIPRYEYKLDSDNKTISVKFIPTSQTTADKDYKIHPVFQDGTSNNFKNGEWDSEISGFWVAKYPAGYQANTITDKGDGTLTTDISNSKDTVIFSDKNYTSYNNLYTTNALGQTLTEKENPKISYPVFKPLTYAYNNISIGDSYTISREIANATNFYGLTGATDSHMLKNSEWGAVVYLTHSQYGRNGNSTNLNEPNMNNYYTNTSSPYKVPITGVYTNGANNPQTNAITNEKPYYYDKDETKTGINGSSTGNITGVYDLNGCIWECTTGYITNGNSNLKLGQSFVAKTEKDTESDRGYLTKSTKYSTVYPYDISNDDYSYNYNEYKKIADNSSGLYGYGDAILETSTNDATASWNNGWSGCTRNENPFSCRGAGYDQNTHADIFGFSVWNGSPVYYLGFRVALVCW